MRNINKNRVFRLNRRIRGLTDYRQRLKFLKSGLTRAVIRKSNNNMLVQLVNYADAGDRVVVSAKSTELRKYGYDLNTGNLVSAYLTGFLVANKAKKLKKKDLTDDIIVDFGLQMVLNGNRLYAAVKGLVDGGLNVRVSEDVFPSEDRISGKHLNSKKDVEKLIKSVKEKISA